MKIGKFIALVKERPILYDSLHPLNKDRKEKDRMWREISTDMNVHIDVAKSRWKSLKDCYTKYLKSKLSPGPAVYIKYVNWQWAQNMEFMKPHVKFGLIITNIELQDNQENDELGVQTSADILGTNEKFATPERPVTPETSVIHGKSDLNERTEIHEESRKRKSSKMQDSPGTLERTYEKIRRRHRAPISPDANTSPKADGYFQYLENKKTDGYSATELIFLGYAKTIKSFSIRRQAEVKMKIAKIMMDEEIAQFEQVISQNDEYHSP